MIEDNKWTEAIVGANSTFIKKKRKKNEELAKYGRRVDSIFTFN